jgi:hypothetical protein
MPSRRKFLLMSGVAAGTLALVGGGAAAFVYLDEFEGWIRNVLRLALPDYDLEPSGLAQFIEEYYETRKDNGRLRLFAATHRLMDARWALNDEMTRDIDEEERKIVSDFLIGSDFFANYPDGTKQITYRGIADACGSPFATF